MINSPALYRKNAPPDRARSILDNVLALERSQVPLGVEPIYSLKHLAHLTSSSYTYLRAITSRELDAYKVYSIRKRDGKSLRSIAAPHEQLLDVQRWLLDYVFSKMTAHSASFAYTPGRSVMHCATEHLGAMWLVRMDLRDFFHQTDEVDVYHLLRRHKYSRLVSLELARIVTRSPATTQSWLPTKYASLTERKVRVGAPYSGPQRLGYLPQGAPPSGAIANSLARQLDSALEELAEEIGGTYTRYADDLTFSTPDVFRRATAERFLGKARAVVAKSGYDINDQKTRIVPPGRALEVLGLLVDGERVRLPVRVRRRIDFHLRGLEKFGVPSHQVATGFSDAVGMLNHIRGLIDYAHGIEPERAAAYYSRLNSAAPLIAILSNGED